MQVSPIPRKYIFVLEQVLNRDFVQRIKDLQVPLTIAN